jgi:hypothetical protein
MWILIGMHTEDSWIRPTAKIKAGQATAIDELGKFEENLKGYYIYAASFLLTIFTTVGYGNDYSHTQIEHIFIIFIEFGSFIVQGGLILGMQKVFNKINLSFEE